MQNNTPANFTLDRRQFIKLAGLATSTAFSSSLFAHGHSMANSKHHSIGLQLYTLRDIMQVSVPATLKLAADVGYNELEFAGYFDHDLNDIKQILEGEGLTSPSAHFPLDMFANNINQIIDISKQLGHKYVVMPWLTEEQRGKDIATYYRLAEDLNRYGETCKSAGLTLAYHNHDFEFENREGELPMDVLLNETSADSLSIELDLYWTVKAGFDPITYFNKYPGRFKLWHVKDLAADGSFADVGKGTIDFAAIFAQAELAGVEHKFVERDQTPDRIKTIEQGYQAMTALYEK